MSRIDEQLSEREEIEMLLPWYATGKLDAEETARVAAYVARHPDMQRQLALIAEEQTATVAGNEAIRPRLAAADVLLTRAATPSSRTRSWFAGLAEGIGSLLAPTSGAVRWVGVAAAAIILVQAMALGALLTRDGGGYRTASRPGIEAQIAPAAMVAFTEQAAMAEIAGILAAHHLRIVDGPLPGGFFSVRFDDVATGDEQQQRLNALAARKDLVKAVLPSR